MSKASRKLKKSQKKKQVTTIKKNLSEYELKLKEDFNHGAYEETLVDLAKLIESGDRNPELFYMGAYSYYMLGDSDRAAKWVSNTLDYAPGHIDARILLARICFSQNRAGDGLAVLDYLVTKERSLLSESQCRAIREAAGYTAMRMEEEIQEKYPELAAFLGCSKQTDTEENEDEVSNPTQEKSAAKSIELLKNLKARLQNEQKTRNATRNSEKHDKEETPAVSVVIPVYNAELYLRACLDSIQGQSITDYEVILVDDASTDGSYAIEEEYGKLPNWHVLCMAENVGPGTARNVGIRHAKGKWITFLDADDMLEPDFLAALVEAGEAEQADVVVSGYRQWEEDESGTRTQEKKVEASKNIEHIPDSPEERLNTLLHEGYPDPVPWGRIMRLSLLKEKGIQFPNMARFEDTVFNLQLYVEAGTYIMVPGIHYQHRTQPHSLTHTSNAMHEVYTTCVLQGMDWLTSYASRLPIVRENPRIHLMLGVYIMNHLTVGLLERYPLEQMQPIIHAFVWKNFHEHQEFVELLLLRYMSETISQDAARIQEK